MKSIHSSVTETRSQSPSVGSQFTGPLPCHQPLILPVPEAGQVSLLFSGVAPPLCPGIGSTCQSAGLVIGPLPSRHPSPPPTCFPSSQLLLLQSPSCGTSDTSPKSAALLPPPCPLSDKTKERKGWLWLHSVLLLMNA